MSENDIIDDLVSEAVLCRMAERTGERGAASERKLLWRAIREIKALRKTQHPACKFNGVLPTNTTLSGNLFYSGECFKGLAGEDGNPLGYNTKARHVAVAIMRGTEFIRFMTQEEYEAHIANSITPENEAG